MDLAALTMLVFGGMITVSGMAGLFMPGVLLSLLGIGGKNSCFARVMQ